MQAWDDPSKRQFIDEWLQQHDTCLKQIHPKAYVDKWGRVCGKVAGGKIDCGQEPDHPPDWDNYRYLWHENSCPDYLRYTVQDYVALRAGGTSREALAQCKGGKDEPCF